LPERVFDRTTRGAQAADWIEWFPAMRGQIRDELERLDRCDTARRCLDLARLHALVEQWPERLGPEHEPEYHLRLMRGIVTGWFIRWFEQTYS